MRAYLAQTIANDDILRDIGLASDAVYSAENVDTPGSKPFIVMRWTDRQPPFALRTAPSQPNLLDVWCYDERGDYSRIDAMLARLRQVLPSIAAQRTETGWITSIEWVGDGGDNYDDVWKAITRTATYRVVASYTLGA